MIRIITYSRIPCYSNSPVCSDSSAAEDGLLLSFNECRRTSLSSLRTLAKMPSDEWVVPLAVLSRTIFFTTSLIRRTFSME